MRRAALRGEVRRNPIWRDASDGLVDALIARAEVREYGDGERMLNAGQPARRVYLLLEGSARIYFPVEGRAREITAKLISAPAVFGEAECAMRWPWPESVEALAYARALAVDAGRYFRLLQAHPHVAFLSYWDVVRRFAITIAAMRMLSAEETDARVVTLIAAYAEHFGADTDEGVLIERLLPLEEIARQVGSTRRSVARCLDRLFRADLLRRRGRRFVVPRLAALLAAAASTSADLSYHLEASPWPTQGEFGAPET